MLQKPDFKKKQECLKKEEFTDMPALSAAWPPRGPGSPCVWMCNKESPRHRVHAVVGAGTELGGSCVTASIISL